MGAPSPVNHFWSLAIEEQFYLVWPPVLLLLFSRRVRKRNIQAGIVVLAAVSVFLMMFLYIPEGDPSRVYYGTDTRAFSLLIGAWLAFVFPVQRVCGHGKRGLSLGQRKILGLAGVISVFAIILLMIFVDTYSPFLYYGGILLVSVLTGVLMLAIVDSLNVVAKVFSVGPLVYIGRISYGIYLWHYPVILLLTDFNSTTGTPWYICILQIVITFCAAAISYHFVEQPIRHGRLGQMYAEIQDGFSTWGQVIKSHIVQVVLTVVLFVGAAFVLIVVPDTSTQNDTSYTDVAVVPEGALDIGEGGLGDGNTDEDGGANSGNSNDDDGATQRQAKVIEVREPREDLLAKLGSNPALSALSDETLQQLVDTPGNNVTEKAENTQFILIGDSVTVAIAGLNDNDGYGGFADTFPNAILDSAISRSVPGGLEALDYYLSNGWNGPVVIYELGTNVELTTSEAESLVSAVPEGKMIFFINVQEHDTDKMDASNSILQTLAANHDNVELIDWYSESVGKDSYFDGDGTHLSPGEGVNAYLQMLIRNLKTLYAK